MIICKRLIFTAVILLPLSCILSFADAQEINCEKLNLVITAVATTPGLNSLKGKAKVDKYAGETEYMGLVTFWNHAGGLEDQYIQFDKEQQEYAYYGVGLTEGTPGKNEASDIKKLLINCLGKDWVLKEDTKGSGDSVYYFKNIANYVVISIKSTDDAVVIELYNDSKNSAPQCINGNCVNYFGNVRYFNEDVYSGTFIGGGLSGPGRFNWYNLKMGYEGSFIDNQVAGYGTMNYNGKTLGTRIYFKGDPVSIDTTKMTCQYGNCQTGFGLKVIAGGFYVGNFKDGFYDGLGELILNKTTFYGHFQKNQITGKGIFINAKGDCTFASYLNGRPTGAYEVDYTDKTSKQGNITDGSFSLFDEDNILNKAGITSGSTSSEYTGADYVSLIAFTKSFKKFYSYRQTGYKEIRGKQNGMLKTLGIEAFKSTLLFLDAFETNIYNDPSQNYHYTVDIFNNNVNKMKSVTIYNHYYDLLNRSLGSRWNITKDDGRADAKKSKSEIVIENIFDKSKTISLSLDRGCVSMEVH